MVSIVASCHGAKLRAHGARDFRSQQYVSQSGLKKCLFMRSSAPVFTRRKRKTHVNGLKKYLFVRINFHVVEPSTPLMLWKI